MNLDEGDEWSIDCINPVKNLSINGPVPSDGKVPTCRHL